MNFIKETQNYSVLASNFTQFAIFTRPIWIGNSIRVLDTGSHCIKHKVQSVHLFVCIFIYICRRYLSCNHLVSWECSGSILALMYVCHYFYSNQRLPDMAVPSHWGHRWTSDQGRMETDHHLRHLCCALRNTDREMITTVTIAPALIFLSESSWRILPAKDAQGRGGIRINANFLAKGLVSHLGG